MASWNPLRTLAGRLVLVTIAAILITHAVAFTVFANERGRALRRIVEQTFVERLTYTAQQLRAADPTSRMLMAQNLRLPGTDYAVAEAPAVDRTTGVVAERLARQVQDAIGGDVRGRSQIIVRERPERDPHRRSDRPPRVERGGAAMLEPPPREDVIIYRMEEAANPMAGFDKRFVERARTQIRETEVTLSVAIAPALWLNARTTLPAPRPPPASLFFAALVSSIAVSFGAILVSRQIGRPLADLTAAARRLGVGETHAPIAPRGPDDVRRASEAFNAMAERLGRQMDRQRQMLWALSHDLRTPITALRLRAELVEDESLRQKMLAPLAEMETLTEQALSLARAGASEEARREVDVAEIARTLAGELADLGLPISADAPTSVTAQCRPSEIARAIRNLAENAARHGGGGVIGVRRGAKGEAIIDVRDEGPGLSDEDRARVLAPFYRADAARSAQDGGAGLGLAIVQAIVDGHGGVLTLENGAQRGLIARIVLPSVA